MLADYEHSSGSWGRRLLWVLIGVAVPVAYWLLSGQPKPAPEGASTAKKSEAPSSPPTPEGEPAPEAAEEPPAEPAAREDAEQEQPSPEQANPSESTDPEQPAREEEATPTETSAPEAPVGRLPLDITLADSKDQSFPARLLSVDRKWAALECQADLQLKDKVKLSIPADQGTLTVGATVDGKDGSRYQCKLMLQGGLRKRFDAFLEEL